MRTAAMIARGSVREHLVLQAMNPVDVHTGVMKSRSDAAAGGRGRQLRILVYAINFHPEPVGTGKYTAEMCEALVAAGHEVRVLTAHPWYPTRSLYEGEATWRGSHWNGIRIYRAPIWAPRRSSGLRRIAMAASFVMASLPRLAAVVPWRPDVVWTVEPSLLGAPFAWLLARLCGARCWLHVQDFEVDAAFQLEILRSPIACGLALRVERLILRRFDILSSISPQMLERLATKGVPAARIADFPNWVDVEAIAPLTAPSSYRDQLGISREAFVALYSGSIGAKQGIEVIATAALALAQDPAMHFVVCGEGIGLAGLREAAAGLHNITWLTLQPADRMRELMGLADAHLLPQRADAADLVLPSKLLAMLASGRPVIAGARPGTHLSQIVEGRGLVVEPEDGAALARAIRTLAADPVQCAQMGKRARELAVNRFSAQVVLGAFLEKLEAFASPISLSRMGRG